MELTRRQAMVGAAGLVAGGAVGQWGIDELPLGTHRELQQKFFDALSPAQRSAIFYPWEHPSRQLVNTLAILKNPHVGTLVNREQMAVVWSLWLSTLSEAGATRFREPLRVEGGGLSGCVLTMYGNPHDGPCQTVISGGHLQQRGGDIPGGALGDGVAYGHQVGNEQLRVPGNVWAFHSDAANRLFGALDPDQRRAAVQSEAPYELTVQLRGDSETFDGLSAAEMTGAQRLAFETLLKDVLSTYPEAQAKRAYDDALAFGMDALHISFYAQHAYYDDGTRLSEAGPRDEGVPYFQVWRIEGPGTVVHFQGDPHVHAYVHIAREPQKQHVGPVLAESPRLLMGDDLRPFIERTIHAAIDVDSAIYPGPIGGRIPRGPVSEGLLWSLDPYGNEVAVLEIKGRDMAPTLCAHMGRVEPERTYRVATADYLVGRRAEVFGQWQSRERTGLVVRDLLVEAMRSGASLQAKLPTG